MFPQSQATVFEELGCFSVLGSLGMNTENIKCTGPLILKGTCSRTPYKIMETIGTLTPHMHYFSINTPLG